MPRHASRPSARHRTVQSLDDLSSGTAVPERRADQDRRNEAAERPPQVCLLSIRVHAARPRSNSGAARGRALRGPRPLKDRGFARVWSPPWTCRALLGPEPVIVGILQVRDPSVSPYGPTPPRPGGGGAALPRPGSSAGKTILAGPHQVWYRKPTIVPWQHVTRAAHSRAVGERLSVARSRSPEAHSPRWALITLEARGSWDR